MQVGTLGRTGSPVTRLALGTGPLGNLFAAVPDDVARAAVDAAWDAGVRAFDTAPHYGLGLAERRLGEALRDRPRDAFTVSTKVGRLLRPVDGPVEGDDTAHRFVVPRTHERVWDFSADGVRRSLEDSLLRLGLDRVDVVLLHDPDLATRDDSPDHLDRAVREGFPALAALRDEGVVRGVGVGMNNVGPVARFLRETDLDVVLLAGRLTLLDQTGVEEVLPLCAEQGVAVLAGAPFHSGLLATEDPGDSATFNYRAAGRDVLDRVRAIAAVCRRHGVTVPQAALQWPLRHPEVAAVLAGLRAPEEVRLAVERVTAPVPEDCWAELEAEGLVRAV